MLSRAGKSTTNQYLAFQKIENGEGQGTPVKRKKENTETVAPAAPVGFAQLI